MQFYASKDSRLEIYHQQNHGVSITRNKLLEKVKGDYILFIDADDWLELNMIKFLVDKLEEYQADILALPQTCRGVGGSANPALQRGRCHNRQAKEWGREFR